MESTSSLNDELGVLQRELARVEDRLAQSQAERDELAIKYSAVSERLEQALMKGDLDETVLGCTDGSSLSRVHAGLRRQLEEEQTAYKRKLQTYQEGQQRQALLVQKLQGKVVQYKKRCGDLEQQLMVKEASYREMELSESVRYRQYEEEQVRSLENTLIRLEEEQQRCSSLAEVNTLLREQLNEANAANRALSEDLHKLTEDWTLVREELEVKEADWRHEEENYNTYLSGEHDRFLQLWKQSVNLGRQFVQMKTATNRDLAEGRANITRLASALQAACLGLGSSLRESEAGNTLSRVKEQARLENMEQEVRERMQEVLQLQVRSQADRAELNARNSELALAIALLESQNAEKERTIRCLTDTVEELESRHRAEAALMTEVKAARLTMDELQTSLQEIAEAVMLDTEDALISPNASEGGPHTPRPRGTSPFSPARRLPSPSRGHSPARLLPAAVPSSTLSAIRCGLRKKQIFIQDLQGKTAEAQESASALRKQLMDCEGHRQALEVQLAGIREENQDLQCRHGDSQREMDTLRKRTETLICARSQLEQSVQSLRNRLDAQEQEIQSLRQRNVEAARQFEELEAQRDEGNREGERAAKETKRCQQLLDQAELRNSRQQQQVFALRQGMEKVTLERDLAIGERAELSTALSKVERSNTELSLSLEKARAEEAASRDSLVKMSTLNEALAQDKEALSKLLEQMEDEKSSLRAKLVETQQEAAEIRQALQRGEIKREELTAEGQRLGQSLQSTESKTERLQGELGELQAIMSELREQLRQATRERTSLTNDLREAQSGLCAQTDLLSRREREMQTLAREKAAIEVQLASVNRERQNAIAELTELRNAKEVLEGNLFEGTKRASEMDCSLQQLESQVGVLQEVKKSLQGELNRLRGDLAEQKEVSDLEKGALHRKLSQSARDSERVLLAAREAHARELERLHEEKRALQLKMAGEQTEALSQLRRELEEATERHERLREELMQTITSLQQERERLLLVSENNKQKHCSEQAEEMALLVKKLNDTQLHLTTAQEDLENQRKEVNRVKEQTQSTLSDLTLDLKETQSQLGEAEAECERLLASAKEQGEQQEVERKAVERELVEVKAQQAVLEETQEGLRRELSQLQQEREGLEEARRMAEREVSDWKRAEGEQRAERQMAEQLNGEIRQDVRRLESEKISLKLAVEEKDSKIGVLEETKAASQAEVAELRSSLLEVERSRLEGRREIQELHRQLRTAQDELARHSQELSGMRGSAESREQELRMEALRLRRRIQEMDVQCEAAQRQVSEIQRKLLEGDADLRARADGLSTELEEARASEGSQREAAARLAGQLEAEAGKTATLRLQLSSTEGRAQGLQEGLARAEEGRRNAETKLRALLSALRQSLGLGVGCDVPLSPDSSCPSPLGSAFSVTASVRASTSFEEEFALPLSEREVDTAAIDVEAVEAALKQLLEKVYNSQMEKDSCSTEVKRLHAKIDELEAEQRQNAHRLQQLHRKLAESEGGLRVATEQLGEAQSSLRVQDETVRHQERERTALRETILDLELNLKTSQQEMTDIKEKARRAKVIEEEAAEEARRDRQSLEEVQSELAESALALLALEGDLRRAQGQLLERQVQLRAAQDTGDALLRKVAQREREASGLREELERCRADEGASQRTARLGQALADSRKRAALLEETVTALRTSLGDVEKELQTVKDRLEIARRRADEERSQHNVQLQELHQRLEAQDTRYREFEAQNQSKVQDLHEAQEKRAAESERVRSLEAERYLTQERLGSLQRAVAQLESEKLDAERAVSRLERERTAARRALEKAESEKVRMEGETRHLSAERKRLEETVSVTEKEWSSTRQQLKELQNQLSELKSSQHRNLTNITTRGQIELKGEVDHLRLSNRQLETTLESRERAHRQRVKGLEEQITVLKTQMNLELQHKHQYIRLSTRANNELSGLRQNLSESLSAVSRDPDLTMLASETRRLDRSLNHSLQSSLGSHASSSPTQSRTLPSRGPPRGSQL